jgi:hypothetical protein
VAWPLLIKVEKMAVVGYKVLDRRIAPMTLKLERPESQKNEILIKKTFSCNIPFNEFIMFRRGLNCKKVNPSRGQNLVLKQEAIIE